MWIPRVGSFIGWHNDNHVIKQTTRFQMSQNFFMEIELLIATRNHINYKPWRQTD